MIAAWMLTVALFASFAAIAAACGEQVLRALGRPARGAWALAMAAALLWPFVMPLVAHARPRIGVVTLPAVAVGDLTPVSMPGASTTWLSALDRAMLALWVLASALLVVRLGVALVRARRIRRGASREAVGGVMLLVSDSTGPALLGVIRPEILLPRALLALDAPLRDVIIRHEEEHRRARDAWLSFGCTVAVTLMPWNPALWWMTQRARLALEIDCDNRVLRTGVGAARYGKLLLLATQSGPLASFAPALASSPTHLERRIRAMLTTPSYRRLRIVLGGVGMLVASVAACAAQVTGGQTNPASTFTTNGRLVELLRARFDSSGLTREEVHERLVQHGYPADVLDPYLATGKHPVPMPTATPGMHRTQRREVSGGGTDTTATDTTSAGRPFFEFQVEKPVAQLPGTMHITYPPDLKAAHVEGEVLAQFVVDTQGAVVPGSFKVLKSSHELFSKAVADALPSLRFSPARIHGRPVRQVVQQPFTFALTKQ